MKGRDTFGPDNPLVVMARLDDRPQQARHANAVAAHMDWHLSALIIDHCSTQFFRVDCAKIENLPHFDPPRRAAAFFGQRVKCSHIMGLVGPGVKRGKLFHHRLALRHIIVIDITRAKADISHLTVIEHFTFTGLGQHQKLMRIIPTDGAGISAHRNRLQAHPLIRAQIADQMTVIGMQRILFGEVEIIAVFHQKLAAPHHPKAWAHFVAELPLHLIQRQRQVFITADMGAEHIGEHFLGGGRKQHIPALPVLHPQHFIAVAVIASAFAPQIGRLQRGHQHRNMAGSNLFFVNDILKLAQHFKAHRQPRIDPGAGLLDHPCAQHQPMADNLGIDGVFFQHGHKVAGQAHAASLQAGNNCLLYG